MLWIGEVFDSSRWCDEKLDAIRSMRIAQKASKKANRVKRRKKTGLEEKKVVAATT